MKTPIRKGAIPWGDRPQSQSNGYQCERDWSDGSRQRARRQLRHDALEFLRGQYGGVGQHSGTAEWSATFPRRARRNAIRSITKQAWAKHREAA